MPFCRDIRWRRGTAKTKQMKTKISRVNHSYWKLEVTDPIINATYHIGYPIVLAVIGHYANSGHWTFNDYRLQEHLIPSAYLDDMLEIIPNFSTYRPSIQDIIKSHLSNYTLDNNSDTLFYWRLNSSDITGNKPHPKNIKACFSFKEAKAKLLEAQRFWDSYTGDISSDLVRLANPNRLPHRYDLLAISGADAP